MLNAVCKLIAATLVGCFLAWVTYKIGAGLGFWMPFGMVVFGFVCGLIYAIAKLAVKKKSEK